jgi:hypothetical protein
VKTAFWFRMRGEIARGMKPRARTATDSGVLSHERPRLVAEDRAVAVRILATREVCSDKRIERPVEEACCETMVLSEGEALPLVCGQRPEVGDGIVFPTLEAPQVAIVWEEEFGAPPWGLARSHVASLCPRNHQPVGGCAL